MSDVALRFGAKDDGLTAQFRQVNKQLDEFESNAREVSDSITGIFKAAGVATLAEEFISGIGEAVSATVEFADATQKARIQLGFTAEEVQRLSFMAGQANVELGAATGAVLKMQKVLGGFEEGSNDAADALDRLGLANDRFRNLSPADQFDAVAQSIAGIADQNERVLRTNQLFGKGGAELLPVIVALGKENAELSQKLELIGGPVGQAAIDKVDRLGDEMDATKIATKNLSTEILALLEPASSAGQSKLQQMIGALRFELSGGGDPNSVAGLTARIDKINEFLNDPNPMGFFTNGGYTKAVRAARDELERLEVEQRNLLDLQPVMQTPPISVSAPGSVGFEETDQEREQRLKEEEAARVQREQGIAQMYDIEQDMALKNAVKLGEIGKQVSDTEIKQYLDTQDRKVQIYTDMGNFLAGVRQTFGLQEINFEEIKNESILEIAGQMFGQLARENSKLAKIQQGIALAQTIWSTGAGIMKAFETLPWPASLYAAAKVALVGAIQVAKIKSTNYSAGSVSGSAPTLSGGSAVGASQDSAAQNAPDVQSDRGATQVYISGMITKDIVDYMIQGLRDGFDRDVVVIPTSSRQAQVIRGNG